MLKTEDTVVAGQSGGTVEAKKVGGYAAYTGTDNRDCCKEKKWKDLVRKKLTRVRATAAMEGSFGTQKEH